VVVPVSSTKGQSQEKLSIAALQFLFAELMKSQYNYVGGSSAWTQHSDSMPLEPDKHVTTICTCTYFPSTSCSLGGLLVWLTVTPNLSGNSASRRATS
jgi:hypothetical protein